LANLTCELRAWPCGTWARLEVDPQTAAGAGIAAWQDSLVEGLQLDGLTAEEAMALELPAFCQNEADGPQRSSGAPARDHQTRCRRRVHGN
jgi:hypothetical protein